MLAMREETQLSARDEQARRLAETLRRQLGPKLCGLMEAPDVVELMLNADGQVWVDQLGQGMSPIGTMPGPTAESLIATVASTIRSTVKGRTLMHCAVSSAFGEPGYAPCPCQSICVPCSLLLALPRGHPPVGCMFSGQHQRSSLAESVLLIAFFSL
jgi:hypothetical protein